MRFEEFEESCSNAQIVVLGPGRAGKTVFAYSVSHLGKTLGIESEEGVHAARGFIKSPNLEIETVAKKEKDPKTGRWVTLPIERQPPIRDRLRELVQKAYAGGYRYVVVDSLTDVAGRFEDEYARKTGNVAQGDWYKIIEGMKTFVRDLKNGNFHLICTCIAAPPKEGALVDIAPSLPGQLREQMLPMFQSIVLITYDRKTRERKLVVDDPGRGICDRFHSFGDFREVDITGKPLDAVKAMIGAAEGVSASVTEDGEAPPPEPSVRKPSRLLRKVVPGRSRVAIG